MGFFDTKLQSVNTLSPEQQALQKTLGNRLTTDASNGVGQYTYKGPLTAPITAPEQSNVDQLARLGAMSEGSLSHFINYDPNTLNQDFQNQVANPAYANFKQNIQPTIEESLPTFSTARGAAVSRALADTTNTLSQQRFQYNQAAQDRSINAATAASNIYAQNQKTLAAPREIQQAGLDKEYTNFFNANQQYQQGIQSMLGFLGVQTQGFINEGSTYDKVLAGVNTAANVVSAVRGGGTSPVNGPATSSPISGATSNNYRLSGAIDKSGGINY